MKVTHKAGMRLQHDTTVKELRNALLGAEVSDDAKIIVNQFKGDQRDPGYTTIEFVWETE